MGRKLVLNGTKITDPTAPTLLSIDRLESAGSLFLVDPTHPVETWSTGVPSNGAVLPNLFGDNLGSLSTGAVDPTLAVSGGINNGTKGKVERSTKGGLHVIVSQANALTAGTDGVRVTMPAALSAYLDANTSHDFYVSAWDRLTRSAIDPDTGTSAIYTLSKIGRASTNLWYGRNGAFDYSRPLGNTVGVRRGNAALITPTVRTADAGYSAGPEWGAPPVGYNAAVSPDISARNLKWPSSVFYRFYVEDLTVSGRSYAEVDALDQQLYTKEVLTAGGRYHGDTFTSASTIA